ncbi:unnamed protein product [Rotaria magnacalcarata]|uniref:Uncharacterized protein n=1 Tax=Rotaria magnacalcarata TaxID=392030 RepID=A0A8S3ISD4_9BILA|nr:unnamed protein product [Rotaria magnacalcarata]CAF5206472.1 unnamed protein product [Rotaria magnacalcarata]
MKDLTISPDIFSNQMASFILDGVTNDKSIDANASFNTINTSNVSNIVVNNTPVNYDDNGNKTYTGQFGQCFNGGEHQQQLSINITTNVFQ